VLALPLVERTPFALVFRAPNATLRVALVERVAPAPGTVLGWTVDDIAPTAALTRPLGAGADQARPVSRR
jgi:hypothetical protein